MHAKQGALLFSAINKCFIPAPLYISHFGFQKFRKLTTAYPTTSMLKKKGASQTIFNTCFVDNHCDDFTYSSFLVLHTVFEAKLENYISHTRAWAFWG